MKTYIVDLQKIKRNRTKIMHKMGLIIRNGGIVVFPTETVYGIGANVLDKDACAKIFKIKGRASDNPLIVHASGVEMIEKIGKLSDTDKKIMEKVWPGPITIIVKARKNIPKVVTGGLSTVAVRVPKNTTALELIRSAGVPIAAPSANPSGLPSATSGEHAEEYFNRKVDAIIKDGRTRYGIESTVIDLKSMTILRPGAFNIKKLEGITGIKSKNPDFKKIKVARSPGMKYRHYSPRTPLFMYSGKINELSKAVEKLENFVVIGSFKFCSSVTIPKNKKIVITTKGINEVKRNLFDALIRLDKMKARFGIIEIFKEQEDDTALMNRIRKASNEKVFSDKKTLVKLLNIGETK